MTGKAVQARSWFWSTEIETLNEYYDEARGEQQCSVLFGVRQSRVPVYIKMETLAGLLFPTQPEQQEEVTQNGSHND